MLFSSNGKSAQAKADQSQPNNLGLIRLRQWTHPSEALWRTLADFG